MRKVLKATLDRLETCIIEGPKGDVGPQGNEGKQGPPGEKGDKGERGPCGCVCPYCDQLAKDPNEEPVISIHPGLPVPESPTIPKGPNIRQRRSLSSRSYHRHVSNAQYCNNLFSNSKPLDKHNHNHLNTYPNS